jgi:hypothetical protein
MFTENKKICNKLISWYITKLFLFQEGYILNLLFTAQKRTIIAAKKVHIFDFELTD